MIKEKNFSEICSDSLYTSLAVKTTEENLALKSCQKKGLQPFTWWYYVDLYITGPELTFSLPERLAGRHTA